MGNPIRSTKIVSSCKFSFINSDRMRKGTTSHYSRVFSMCDRILQNPAYGTCAQLVQCAFLVPQVKNCQTSNFVVAMSKNLSSNCCHRLRRLGISYQGKISLYRRLDLPSRCSCRAWSPLLWALIRIRASGLSRRMLTHVLSLLDIEEVRDEVRDYLRSF